MYGISGLYPRFVVHVWCLYGRSDLYPGSELYRVQFLHTGIRVHQRRILHDGTMLYRWTDVYTRSLVHIGCDLYRWSSRLYDWPALHIRRLHRLHELHPG